MFQLLDLCETRKCWASGNSLFTFRQSINTASGAWALVCLFSPLEYYKAKTYIQKK